MRIAEFQEFLRKKGKQAHVATSLGKYVEMLELFTRGRLQKEIADLSAAELESYLHSPEVERNNQKKNLARAIALYFAMLKRADLVKVANDFREAELNDSRQPLNLDRLIGVEPAYVSRLSTKGIVNAVHLLKATCTKAEREGLAKETGIPYPKLLELVKLADLTRIMGVKAVRARLYVDAGVDTMDKIAAWEPEAFVQMIREFVQRTKFDGIATLPKEAEFTIAEAKRLPRMVEYEGEVFS